MIATNIPSSEKHAKRKRHSTVAYFSVLLRKWLLAGTSSPLCIRTQQQMQITFKFFNNFVVLALKDRMNSSKQKMKNP